MTWEVGTSYRIWYQSEAGRATERTIDLLRVSRAQDGRVFLKAYCHLRNEERTFRADRVLRSECLTVRVSAHPASVIPFDRTTPPVAPTSVPSVPPFKPAPTTLTPPAVVASYPYVAVERPVSDGAKSHRTFGEVIGNIIGYGIAAVFVFAFLGNIGVFESYSGSSSYRPTASYSYAPAPKPVQPPSPPKPSLEETTIGGRLLRTYRNGGVERYEVPSLGLATASKVEAIAAIRLPTFVAVTGLTNPSLISRYLEADLNGSGKLSFDELETFQRKTYREFRYEANELALRPDEFLEAKGGDCEDFALYTAGLLRFWGWEPYLGSLGPARGGVGHAVCLSYEEGSFSGGYTYFEVEAWTTEDGTGLKPGKYVPIDYDQVGGLTNAVEKGWKLRSIYTPEKAWGLRM
jgi:transglutaminase-like putative cysteine protease